MKRILLVDDNPTERQGIHFLLCHTFPELDITICENGYEALEKAKKKEYHLMLTDIKMPLMTGIELCQNLRQFNLTIKIIIISGYESFDYAKQLLKYGVTDYLLKPISPNELIDTVKEALKETKEQKETSNAMVAKAIQLLKENYQKDIRLDEVASLLFLTPSYLSSIFKQETGSSFIHYLTCIRIKKAKHLLEQSTMKITMIGKYVGIENNSYFNKVFKKEVGLTPSDYRIKCLKEGQ